MIELMQKKKMLLNICLKMQMHPWSNVDIVVIDFTEIKLNLMTQDLILDKKKLTVTLELELKSTQYLGR